MGQTITEKILAASAGVETVEPGQIVNARLDAVIGHDIGGTAAFRELEKRGIGRVFDPDKVYITADHFVPSPTLEAAGALKDLTAYMERYGIRHWFPQGQGGICHALFPERGLVRPGMVIVGADSHTCTYGALGAFATGMGMTDIFAALALGEIWLKVPASLRFDFRGKLRRRVTGKDLILFAIGQIGVDGALYKAMEFTGEAIRALSMDERFTVCNMAIEAGAKNGIIAPDAAAAAYLAERCDEPCPTGLASDPDAAYEASYAWDAAAIPPLVAQPHSPGSIVPAAEAAGVRVDQVVIGSCTNGRIGDLRAAAEILRGNRVAKGVRLLVFPATQAIYLQAVREGLIEDFIAAGATIAPPVCGPCLGGHLGLLADGEVAVTTTNRNFPGRMGHKGSRVYLASPYTAAAAAVAGCIVDPAEVAA
ncbi:MAG: 3-isopropylmalate dehydratase large subunit [Rhodospirillaceae bacterium]